MKIMFAGKLSKRLGLAAALIVATSTPCRGGESVAVSSEPEEAGMMNLEAKARSEVMALHQFFEDWFLGLAGTEYSRLETALAADFEMVTPGGIVVTRGPLIEQLRGALGSWRASPKKIEIRDISSLYLAGGWILVRYEEWHLPEQGEAVGRLSTAVFRSTSAAPLGVEWVRLQETWLPAD